MRCCSCPRLSAGDAGLLVARLTNALALGELLVALPPPLLMARLPAVIDALLAVIAGARREQPFPGTATATQGGEERSGGEKGRKG